MSRLPFLCVFGVIASVHLLKAQESGPSVSEYSNGGLEMTVEHAKPEPGVTWEGQNLYGILTIR